MPDMWPEANSMTPPYFTAERGGPTARPKRRKRKRYQGWLWKTKQRKCAYCGKKLGKGQITADHVKPLSKGGYDKRKNVVPACAKCNHAKGAEWPYAPPLSPKQ